MKYGLGSYPRSSEADIGFIGGGTLCRVCVVAGQAAGGYPVWMLISAQVKIYIQAHIQVSFYQNLQSFTVHQGCQVTNGEQVMASSVIAGLDKLTHIKLTQS